MQFNSLQFAAFFAIVWAAVVLASRIGDRVALRNGCLLVASYVFYSAWDWRFLGLILFSTSIDYGCGVLLEAADESARRRRRLLLWVSLVANLGLLGFFKYFGFFVDSAAELLTLLGLTVHRPTLQVILPVGISFYTFQTLGYTIDVYRRRIRAERNPLHYATYVAFFPQLVAGPIERAASLLPQFRRPSTVSREMLRSGLYLIGWGLFKKVVIADNVAKVSDAVFKIADPTGPQVLIGAYAFAVQIYCDFSGYTDIARGAARCLGFELTLNFDLPYFSSSPSEFWRRWHISLSSWLRDYLYIPLGGNRKGTLRTYANLMITMVLGGLWHGAAATFVAWGAFHGALLWLYRVLTPRRPGPAAAGRARRSLGVIFFFHLVCAGWILFRAPTLAHAFEMFVGLASWPGGEWLAVLDAAGPIKLAATVTGLLAAFELAQYAKGDELFLLRLPWFVRAPIYSAALLIFAYLGEYRGPEFIYFQF